MEKENMGNDNILIVVVLAVMAFLFLKDETPEKDIEAQKRAADICVGKTGLNRFLCETGVWIVGAPTQSPQTPAPTPTPRADYCPYDVNILAGDSRCVPERVYNYVPRIPECPEGTYPTWWGGCEAGGRHL